jgi:uncharacterized protein YgiM (DUF1202 family)
VRRALIKVRAVAALGAAGMILSLMWPQAASATTQTTQMTATVGVNIRSEASTKSDILGGLYRGQTVTAVSSSGGWTKIKFAGSTAYVASRYLSKGKSCRRLKGSALARARSPQPLSICVPVQASPIE